MIATASRKDFASDGARSANGRRASRSLVGMVVMFAACAHAPVARPALIPSDVEEFVIPWENAFPSDIALDDEGRVWFTDRMTSAIGRFDPADTSFTRIETPTPKSAPYGFVRGPDGALWYAASRAGRLGRIDPAADAIEEIVLPGVSGGPQLLAVHGERIWFTARDGRMYGSIDTRTHAVRVYASHASVQPYGIAATTDGVWIGGHDGTFVMRIDPVTDRASLHDLSMPDSTLPRMRTVTRPDGTARVTRATDGEGLVPMRRAHVRRMAAGADGRIWLTDFNGARVLSFRGTSSVDEYASVNRRSEPYGIAVDSTGRVWFYERGNSEVVALDPDTGERVRFRVPTAGAVARSIAIDDARGRVWLPLSDRGRIGLIRLRPESVGGQR